MLLKAKIFNTLLLVFLAVIVLLVSYKYRWLCDDSLINFRIAEQIISRNGPVFNIGDRVEAFTSPIWLLILTLFAMIMKIDVSAIVLGILFTTIGIVIASLTIIKFFNKTYNKSFFYIPLGAIILFLYPPFWEFATSGLENSLILLYIAVSYLLYYKLITQAISVKMRILIYLFFGLAVLVRPELFVFSTILILFSLKNFSLKLLRPILFYCLPGVVYEIFRMGYYGEIVSNTAIDKEFSMRYITRGAIYVLESIDKYHLFLYLGGIFLIYLILLFKGQSSLIKMLLPFLLSSIMIVFYVIYIGGDYMLGRMFLTPLEILLLPLLIYPLSEETYNKIVLAICILCFFSSSNKVILVSDKQYAMWDFQHRIVDERDFYMNVLCDKTPDRIKVFTNGCFNVMNIDSKKPTVNIHFEEKYYRLNKAYPYPTNIIFPKSNKAFSPKENTYLGTAFLGALGEKASLNDVVFDTIGLSYSLAAHIKQDKKSRLFVSYKDYNYNSKMKPFFYRAGHSKIIPLYYLIADNVQMNSIGYNTFLTNIPIEDRDNFNQLVLKSKEYLTCSPDIKRLISSQRAPLTPKQFLKNIGNAPKNTKFRFSIDPYDNRCG